MKRVLAIGAHPDDIEFGCYGTLCLLAEMAEIHALILCPCAEDGWGEISGRPTRAVETERALRPVTADRVTVLDMMHKDLEFPAQENVRAVEGVLRELKPSVVFTQVRWDVHQDHRTLEKLTITACRRMPVTIIGYHAPSAQADFQTNMVVDITRVFESKLQALAQHKSQKNQPYMQHEWLYNWHREKVATAAGYSLVELFHIYQVFWPPLGI